MFGGSGSSGACNSAPVNTSFCHDEMSSRSVSDICGGVALFSKSFTTRFANVVASVPMHVIVVRGEYSLLFAPTGEALIANGRANAHGRLF